MENLEPKSLEGIECNSDFILRSLNLIADNEQKPEGLLKLEPNLLIENPETKGFEKTPLDNPSQLFSCFENASVVAPDKICRSRGDTTFFTTAGVQHVETILREKGKLERELFCITQPVIRSQFIDKVKDGTSTSFINFSVEFIRSNPNEFIDLCNKLIKLIVDRGVNARDLRFAVKNSSVKWGNKKFSNISLTVYFNNIELGECVYIRDYPVIESEKIAITDLGFGVERLNWGIGGSKYYLPDFEKFYENEAGKDSNNITAIIDCVRSMVLIAGEGVKPSNHNHGYRLRQFSKRFVLRKRGVYIDVDELIHICYEGWKKWGYKPTVGVGNIVETIKLENDRNFNNLFLLALQESEEINIYVDINQSTVNFLKQIGFSLPKEVINKIIEKIK